ncbi:MAG: PAS domain-containing protein [Planctomycetes bacterium]|nr:PAS domain-containing protein [Planctomycetota bacterium]
MKTAFRRCFVPAIQFLNRYTFPRKFAIAGTLVVLPLIFVTSQYVNTLNERVETSRQELAGNQTIRLLIPLWRTLRESRLAAIVAATGHEPQSVISGESRERMQHLLDIIAADVEHSQILEDSARWSSFRAKIRIMLASGAADRADLPESELLGELIEDLHTILRHLADLSRLSVDQHLDSQNLAVSITTLIPDLMDMEDRVRDRIAYSRNSDQPIRLDLELAEFNGGLNVLFGRVQQHLNLSMQRNPEVGGRVRGLLSVGQASVRRIETGIRRRHLHSEDAPSLGEIDSQTAAAIRETVALLNACQDAFDEVVEQRTSQAQAWRLYLLMAALMPMTLAGYLVIGLCMAIIQTADQMRDVTERILTEDDCQPVKLTIEAQDELGRMIEHFGQLAVRLREEWVLAHAEAARASSAEESLRINQERFNLVLQGANDGIWDWDLRTDRVFYSDRFKELLGYDKGEFDVWLSALADVLHPDDFDMTWQAVERHFQDREPYHIEHRLRTRDGEYRWFLERGQAVWDASGVPFRMAGSIKDITVRKATESRDRVRNRVLELLASGASLTEVLDPLVQSIESESPRLRCSILFLDKGGTRLLTGAAPSLPAEYAEAINGIEIGMGVGSCGTAAFLGERVVVEDIATHPYWNGYRDLALDAGLVSCWSEPIRGKSGAVLGTFAIYGTEKCAPTESEIRLIEVASNLAGIAIERKQVDAALLESEERWKFALEGAGDGVWDWNIQTGEVVFSRRWCEMLGFAEHELEHSLDGWKSRIHPDDLPIVMTSLQDYLGGKSVSYMNEHRMLCQDGSVRWILSRGIIVSCDPAGAALRMIGTHSDITDRKRMEEDSSRYLKQVEASRDRITEQSIQLIRQSEELARARDQAEAAARAKSEFLANMSHELRTPLTAILGYADLLYDEDDSTPAVPHRETIDIIRSNGRHLQELIDDILDLSKIEADRMTLEPAQVSPRELVQDVLRLMQLRAAEKGLQLQTEFCFPMPERITTDALRVRQILVNLVGNAIKFTQRGIVKVIVRYETGTQRQFFTVSDSGIGIKEEQLHRLFTPFSQADASMSRRFGGTGLGLSISKRLANMLGGDITASSEFGSGSRFTLEIKAEPCAGTELLTCAPPINSSVVAITANSAVLRLSGRILLAEDVLANQKLIAFLLQKWGADVQVVDNGLLAVDAVLKSASNATSFDLILMDIQMPEMDGYTATALLRSKGYSGQIIALTAHASDEDRDRCLDSGFDGFAVKPIQKDQLFSVCERHLALAQNPKRVVT